MSIYSGFATRQQQQAYDHLVEDLLFVLQKRILKFYAKESAQELKFFDIMMHIHSQMIKMEEHKYLEPKTSKSVDQLLKYLVDNTPGAHQYLRSKKNHDVKVTPSYSANTMPMKLNNNKLRTHRDSLTQLNEPTSIGKIIRQVNNSAQNDTYTESMFDSRHKIINTDDRAELLGNPEQHHQVNQFDVSKRLMNKNGKATKHNKSHDKPRDYLLDYLQKNSKNYLRGYRKRQVKTRNMSTTGKVH